MAKQAKRRSEDDPAIIEVISGLAPTSFDTHLTTEQLRAGEQHLVAIVQQACTNTTQYEMLVASADFLRGAYDANRSYLVSELCGELGGISSATLKKYAQLAGLKTPGRGQRDFRYSAIERRQIYRHITEASSDTALVSRCHELLGNRN
jgi:hypothetical protein